MASFLHCTGIFSGVVPPSGISRDYATVSTGLIAEDAATLKKIVESIKRANPTGLMKGGQCYDEFMHKRPFNASQYPGSVFRPGAFCVMTGMLEKSNAEDLENVLIDLLGDRGVKQQVRLEVRSERSD